MLHLRVRPALALGAAVILTLTACAKTIEGKASLAGGAVSPTSQADPGPDTSTQVQTTEILPTEDVPDDVPTDEFPTDLGDLTEDLPTDFGDLTEDFPTDLGDITEEFPTDFSFGSLPDGWPEGIQLPEDASIYGGESNESGMTVVFQTATSAADLASQLDSEIEAAGYTQTDDTVFGGVYAYTYTETLTSLTLGIIEYGGQTVGTISITPN